MLRGGSFIGEGSVRTISMAQYTFVVVGVLGEEREGREREMMLRLTIDAKR